MKQFLISYFLFSFFFLAFFASGFVDSQDGFQYLAIARRMYYDGTFELPDETFETGDNIPLSPAPGRDGKNFSPTGLGYTLSLLPAVMIEDLFLRLTNEKPLSAFPLESDWPVLLVASMTNAAWGALLVIGLYLYLREIRVLHVQALFLSFSVTVGTNLLVYTKHTFAQMMFTSCLMWAFLLLRKYVSTTQWRYLVGSGFMFGLVIISYNPTFLFAVPALGVYYLFLKRFKVKVQNLVTLIKEIAVAFIGGLPWISLYMWFNQVRFGGAASTGYMGAAAQILTKRLPVYVIIEGIWGLLFSPGKSIFLYSPILVLLFLFWFKFKQRLLPEIMAAAILFFTYLWYIGTLLGGADFLVWHGDSSWGPRYMFPTLPMLLVLVGYLFTQLSTIQKKVVFLPLLLMGIYINFLGVVLPYQIRFAGLQTDAMINGRNFNVYEYGNEIPRYAPVFKLSKTFFKRLKNLPQLYDHGVYNVKLIDGFDPPFDLGWMIWRGMRPFSVISFDQAPSQKIETLSFQIKNHLLGAPGAQQVLFNFTLNGQTVKPFNATQSALQPDEEKELKFDLSQASLLSTKNIFTIESVYESSSAAQLEERQALFLQILRINNQPQNIATIDYPYVSPISKKLFNLEYYYLGNRESNPWPVWHAHSGVFEQTFDLWWLRPFHYWDFPKDFFAGLFILNVLGISTFGWKVLSWKEKS